MSSILNTVYNHYLSAYAPNQLTKYDSHKKSELQSVYNSIVKLNKESPWYLPTTNKDTQEYAVMLKENAHAFHNLIASLGGMEESGLLDKKTAYSSNTEVAGAAFIGTYHPGDDIPSLTLEVTQLASPQENLGKYLPDSKIKLKPGSYSFDIAISDMNYEFQFTISESDTNKELQTRLVRLINNADIGLKASLSESEGRTALKLTSNATGATLGKPLIFRVSDKHTSKASGAVDYLGLDYVSREPANARFILNDEERISTANQFTISNLFKLQLNSISPEGEPVTIGLKNDTESFADNVTQLIDGYNTFVKAASSYQTVQPGSNRLVHEIRGIVNCYRGDLEALGLALQEDNSLEIDRRMLSETAADATDIRKTFGFLRDFSNQLLTKTNQVSLNPMDYVEKIVVAYKNPGHNFITPYVTSAYSGMLFNGYC